MLVLKSNLKQISNSRMVFVFIVIKKIFITRKLFFTLFSVLSLKIQRVKRNVR